jgi:hypothetical protein
MNEETQAELDLNPDEPTPDNQETADDLGYDTSGGGEEQHEEPVDNEQQEEPADDEPQVEETENPDKPEGGEQDAATTKQAQAAAYADIAKDLFPEREFESDQERIEAIKEHVQELSEYKGKASEREAKFMELFNDNPDLVDLIHLVGLGANVEEALPFITGDTDIDIEDAKVEWQKKAAEKAKARKEQQGRTEEINKNLKKSFDEVESYAKENKWDDKTTANFLTEVDKLMGDVAYGRISKDIITKLHKALIHDQAVKEAAETAEVRGRNEAITDIKTKGKTKTGDGLPHPKSANTEADESYDQNSPEAVISAGIKHFADSKKF